MKRSYIGIIGFILPSIAMAQSAIDAQQVTQSDFKGTARYMSMGGAFTALGGDLTAISQNPAGIGIYRSSEVGVTLDIDMQSTKTPLMSNLYPVTNSQTKVYCNNFGYVGATRLDGAMKTFNWGVTFNRAASFDRVYRGYMPQISTSLSNYVADFSNGYAASKMHSDDWNKYNPYFDTDIDWFSILAYNTFLINPVGVTPDGGNTYAGLYKKGTTSDALYSIREKGYVDQYDITFGGNVENVVYWGIGIGITDLSYKRWAYYSESLNNANVPADNEGNALTNGRFEYHLDNMKIIDGSGWNLKAGVIIKPVNELRVGLSVQTPTFYKLNQTYRGSIDYTFTPTDNDGFETGETVSDNDYTEDAYFDWKLNAPWRFNVGVAGVVGGRAIISADYEFAGYNSMNIKTPWSYDNWGGYDYVADEAVNSDISTYFRNQNTLRFGVEYRVTPQFSIRGGYNLTMSNVHDDTYNGKYQVLTSGTDPSFSFDDKTQHITCGLGYRYQSWYIDAAYVYKNRESVYHAFTNYDNIIAPSSKLTDNNSSIVISTGFKF